MASAGDIATPDFAQLYAQLGLRADCSLDEFKQTCRRRIAELHPDRDRNDPALAATGLALDDLLALYVKAVRFHRRHGRLPGAAPQPAMHSPAVAQVSPEPAEILLENESSAIADPGTQRLWLRHAPLIAIATIVLLLIAIGSWNDRATPMITTPPARVAHRIDQSAMPATIVEAPVVEQLALDMQPDEVLAIQGEPMQREGDIWEYGPSWLKFEHNRLVDWRSSPLHPLKSATPSPPPRKPEDSEASEGAH
ncbi:MAG: hypothetical protein ABJA62_08150 [Luteimonas sp.]